MSNTGFNIEVVDNMNEVKYPYFIEREYMALDKRFNGELCHHTGRVMINGSTSADVWNEYIDSKGELHYGR